ncbi:MAG: hypothetical protein NZ651_06940 [Candidatus Bipolaricaulota bacterium]|nr:hypothetical protein [Candidatus Bipolaricaulota bacterium]MDW8127488.1 hypothetical protein [Candidatus Bipolaricaulota bacterium]
MQKVFLWGLTGVLIGFLAFPGFSLTVKTGTGTPRLEGWCQVDWKLGSIIGHGGVTEHGLILSAAQVPPIPSYELNLKFVKNEKLRLFFESPNPAGTILIYLDEELVNMAYVPTMGPWWMELEDLPASGFLRVELGSCTDALLIRGIYYPCQVCPSCVPWFVVGVLVGALLVWLVMR